MIHDYNICYQGHTVDFHPRKGGELHLRSAFPVVAVSLNLRYCRVEFCRLPAAGEKAARVLQARRYCGVSRRARMAAASICRRGVPRGGGGCQRQVKKRREFRQARADDPTRVLPAGVFRQGVPLPKICAVFMTFCRRRRKSDENFDCQAAIYDIFRI